MIIQLLSYFLPCTDLIETKIDTTHDNQVLWLSTQGTQVFIFEKFVLTTVIDFLLTTVLKNFTQFFQNNLLRKKPLS